MRVIYKHENSILDCNGRRAKFYVNGRLRFMGDHYIAIKFFIQHSEDHPDVLEMFKNQLEQREKPRFAQNEREKRQEEYRNRPMEEPTPKPTTRSKRRDAKRFIY